MNWIRNRKRLALAAVVGVLVVGSMGAVWYLRPDPRVLKVRQLQAQLMSEAGRSLPAEQRRQAFQQMREEMRQLPPEKRRQMFGDQRQRRRQETEKYLKLSKGEKVAYLDRQIDRMEVMRKEFAAMRAQGGNPGGPPRPRAQTDDEREQRRRQRLDATTPEQRAALDQIRQDMAQRRQERGLPPLSGPGWRGGPGR
jgi:uncharacterized membrane protein